MLPLDNPVQGQRLPGLGRRINFGPSFPWSCSDGQATRDRRPTVGVVAFMADESSGSGSVYWRLCLGALPAFDSLLRLPMQPESPFAGAAASDEGCIVFLMMVLLGEGESFVRIAEASSLVRQTDEVADGILRIRGEVAFLQALPRHSLHCLGSEQHFAAR